MEKFDFFCFNADCDVHVILENNKQETTVDDCSDMITNIIVHRIRPFKASVIRPYETVSDVAEHRFKRYDGYLLRFIPQKWFNQNKKQLEGDLAFIVKQTVLEVENFKKIKDLPAGQTSTPSKNDVNKVEEYLDEIVDLACDRQHKMFLPFKCESCGEYLNLISSPGNWMNFDSTIRHQPFFLCNSCNAPISKITILNTVSACLELWQKNLKDQKVFYKNPSKDEEESDDSSDDDSSDDSSEDSSDDDSSTSSDGRTSPGTNDRAANPCREKEWWASYNKALSEAINDYHATNNKNCKQVDTDERARGMQLSQSGFENKSEWNIRKTTN